MKCFACELLYYCWNCGLGFTIEVMKLSLQLSDIFGNNFGNNHKYLNSSYLDINPKIPNYNLDLLISAAYNNISQVNVTEI